ncbi:universal stress protein family, putative [Synechococcus sp. PCC 7335]|uniref:universal stress protein n=1 Tax=Synechococcus sp. (strain ATCC 29403 / PCC 7335) TaxID=91464 RepID=UPI00017ECB61|nr:universal stress protein [Synechococcus sp. PCC 7335]EDX83420.1 universal stress protein family, putative [Synechococcus sp. PCC 7335]
MLKKIMVAIDESAASEWAFDLALEMAKALNAELTLIHVLDVYSPTAPQQPHTWADTSMEINEAAHREYRNKWNQFVNRYEALLKKYQGKAKSAGVSAQYKQPYGHPGPTLVKTVKEDGIDLMVVGNHDPSTTESSVLGSVSNYLVHHSPCSVTVVHPNNKQGSESRLDRSEFAPLGVV